MTEEQILVAVTAVIVVGIGAQWSAWRMRLPSILLLLVCGLVLGPVSGYLDPDALLGDLLFPCVSLSVGLILFEGGLSLELKELRTVGKTVLRLVTIGAVVTWLLAALAGAWLAGLSWPLAIVFGALMSVTGPTVVGPLLRHVRPQGPVGVVAKWEGIVVDPVGATLAVLAFEAVLHFDGSSPILEGCLGLLRTLAVGSFVGWAGAFVLGRALQRHWVPDALQNPVALALVMGVFTLGQTLQHEAGLLAVTLMGFLLANRPGLHVRHIVEFKENLRVLLITILFILLSARLDLAELAEVGLGGVLFVLALVLIVRPAAVFLSTAGTGMPTKEKLFLSWLAPRGIVAAAVSAVFVLRLEEEGPERMVELGIVGADALGPLAFMVIVGTVAIYGLTAAPLARWLGLAQKDAQGVLIAGASDFALALVPALMAGERRVVLVDTNRRRVTRARLAGFEAVHASVLDEDLEHQLDLGGIGHFLALTSNDEVNTLAALHFAEVFGRANVYQLVPQEAQGKSAARLALRGRELFHEEINFDELEDRVALSASIKRTTLTDSFELDDFHARHGAAALPLLRVDAAGNVHPFVIGEDVEVSPGETLISLVDAAEPEEIPQ